MRTLVHALVLALPMLSAASPLAALADERPRSTVTRPVDGPKKELILLVGGLDSEPSDKTWDPVVARFFDDPRYEIRRFGALAGHPYRTDGSLDGNAAELVAEVRELSPRYSAVHLVSHSMGGAVVDHAFAQGLSTKDGVRTYVALSVPHSGATAAMAGQALVTASTTDATELRGVFAAVKHDPGSDAARDLARIAPPAPPPGVARLDVRLATDYIVLSGDAAAPGVATRSLLPVSAGELVDGHGAILGDRRALDLVAATIADGHAPPDDRGRALALASDAVNLLVTILFVVGCLCVGGATLATFYAGRPWSWLRRPVVERAIQLRRR